MKTTHELQRDKLNSEGLAPTRLAVSWEGERLCETQRQVINFGNVPATSSNVLQQWPEQLRLFLETPPAGWLPPTA